MQKVVIICPGIHNSQLTHEFLAGLQRCNAENVWHIQQLLLFPSHEYPAYSAIHILNYLQRHLTLMNTSVTFISFSAGVVGAIGAAWGWQMLGGTVKALVALDGWGVPLYGTFPIHRLSHDYFTHWSSALLGSGGSRFYADPPVEHLTLWEKPDSCLGWGIQPLKNGREWRRYLTAAEFVVQLLSD
jgi:hypothetical protein